MSGAAECRRNTSTPMKGGEKIKAALDRSPCCQFTHCVKIQQSNYGWSSKNKSELNDHFKWLWFHTWKSQEKCVLIIIQPQTTCWNYVLSLFCFSCIWNAYSKELQCTYCLSPSCQHSLAENCLFLHFFSKDSNYSVTYLNSEYINDTTA